MDHHANDHNETWLNAQRLDSMEARIRALEGDRAKPEPKPPVDFAHYDFSGQDIAVGVYVVGAAGMACQIVQALIAGGHIADRPHAVSTVMPYRLYADNQVVPRGSRIEVQQGYYSNVGGGEVLPVPQDEYYSHPGRAAAAARAYQLKRMAEAV